MFQTWSKQLENEGIWALYRVFPLFSSENTFFSVHKKNIEVSFQQFQRYGNFKYRQLWRLMINKQNNTILKQNLVYSAMNNTLESNTESEMKK
jgi:hypothetical protein